MVMKAVIEVQLKSVILLRVFQQNFSVEVRGIGKDTIYNINSNQTADLMNFKDICYQAV